MKKAEFVAFMAERADIPVASARGVLDAIIETLIEAIRDEGKVSLPGLGVLSVRTRRARIGRNPRTGAEIHIPAMDMVRFRSGKALSRCIGEERDCVAPILGGTGGGGPGVMPTLGDDDELD